MKTENKNLNITGLVSDFRLTEFEQKTGNITLHGIADGDYSFKKYEILNIKNIEFYNISTYSKFFFISNDRGTSNREDKLIAVATLSETSKNWKELEKDTLIEFTVSNDFDTKQEYFKKLGITFNTIQR